MSKIAEMKKWQADVFLPWQAAAEKFNDKQAQQMARIRRHATEVKTMVALILDGDAQKAADLWNRLDFEPALKNLAMKGNDTLLFTLLDGAEQRVALDDLLLDLQEALV